MSLWHLVHPIGVLIVSREGEIYYIISLEQYNSILTDDDCQYFIYIIKNHPVSRSVDPVEVQRQGCKKNLIEDLFN